MTEHAAPSVLAIIPARGGSKGISRKNLCEVGGIALLDHAIKAAQDSGVCDRFCVTTEDNEIAARAARLGAAVVRRPRELSGDTALVVDAVIHALARLAIDGYAPEAVVLLQPTSPLRSAMHVRDAVAMYHDKQAGSVISVTEAKHHPQKMLTLTADGALRPLFSVANLGAARQALPPAFRQNGAIYVVRVERLIADRSFFVPPAIPYVMDADSSVDVDTADDLAEAERIWARSQHGRSSERKCEK